MSDQPQKVSQQEFEHRCNRFTRAYAIICGIGAAYFLLILAIQFATK